MDEQRKDELKETNESGNTPRPAWQVWAARIGLLVFSIYLVMYYMNILRGGM